MGDPLTGRSAADPQTQTPIPAAGTLLYCIPHAGGNAAFYTALAGQLPASIVCHPLELPGRGRRHREPLSTGLEAMARDLYSRMTPQTPYALFGHSMGALLALLCAVQAQKDAMPLPRALFISAAAAPLGWEQCRPPALASLPAQAMWDRVARLGGLPDQIAASQDFLKYLEPILRADFAALESWTPPPLAPLPVPIAVFRGDRDMVTEEQARQWRQLTSVDFRLHTFPGSHFYLQDHWRSLADHISRALGPER